MDYKITEEKLFDIKSVMRQLRLMYEMLMGVDFGKADFRPDAGDLMAFIQAQVERLDEAIEAVEKRHSDETAVGAIRYHDLVNMMLLCAGLGHQALPGARKIIEGKLNAMAAHSTDASFALNTWNRVMDHCAEQHATQQEGQQTGQSTATKASRAGLVKNASKAAVPTAKGTASGAARTAAKNVAEGVPA